MKATTTKTILMIDNDEDFRETRALFLRDQGFQVHEAGSIDEARQALNTYWIHLIIADMRVHDDDDVRDRSGLQFIQEAKYDHIPKIMMTGYPDRETQRIALRRSGGQAPAFDYIEKLHKDNRSTLSEREEMLKAVEDAFAEHYVETERCAVRWLDASLTVRVAQLAKDAYQHAYLRDRVAEVEDLLRLLFKASRQIVVMSAVTEDGERIGLLVNTFGYTDDAACAWLVFVGGKKVFFQDSACFTSLYGSMPVTSLLHQYKPQSTMRYCALAYMLAQADADGLMSFAKRYAKHSAENIQDFVYNLFEQALAQWHKTPGSLREQILSIDGSKKRQDELQAIIEAICTNVRTLRLDWPVLKGSAIQFLEDSVVTGNPSQRIATIPPHAAQLMIGKTHGAVNVSALLTNEQGSTWPLHFGAAASDQAVLNDFITFDMSMRLDLPHQLSVTELAQVEAAVIQSQGGDGAINLSSKQKRLASLLREHQAMAMRVTGCSQETYEYMLFRQALTQLLAYDVSYSRVKSELRRDVHLLLLVALLADKLGEMSELDAPQVEYDAERNTVLLNGETVELTGTESALFAFLYKNANRVVSRAEITEKVFDGGESELFETEHERQHAEDARITVNIGRLRQKLSKVKGGSALIRTVRGAGYELVC